MHEDPTLPLSDEHPAPREAAEPLAAWGPFRLLARVGYGGFGEVYRAWDPSLEREVALKLLLPSPTGAPQTDHEYRAMLREARAIAAIQHPNIVHVYGIDRHDNRVGFWTDFVKGRTLSSLLSTQGPFGYREAALMALDIARALSAVHRAGILHRDIKAENVMREEGGRILLMDFGLSTLPHRETQVAGTPNYIAPELWRGGPASPQTDLYALGILLFHLVTGDYPVRLGGLSAQAAVAAIDGRRTLLDLRSDLPESFLRTVATAIDPEPARRFATAGQLAASLSECLGTAAPLELLSEPPVANAPVAATPAWRRNVTPRIAGIALAPALVIAIALGAAAWQTRAVKHLLHPPAASATAGLPGDASESEEYLKAQNLLRHSYLDANLAAAVTGFHSVLASNPTDDLAYAGLGTAYFEQYRNSSDATLLDQAKAAIDKSLQLNPKAPPAAAYATLARMEAMAGHTDIALQKARKALELEPRNVQAQAALAEVYDAQGKYADAIDAIQKAIDLAPEDSMLLVSLGNYDLDKGDSTGAAATWQKAVDLDPRNVSALFDLGIVEMRSDQLAKARSNFQKVLNIQPDSDSYKNLATLSLLEDDYKQAIAMDKRAVSMNPQSYQAWGNLAGAYAWSGDRANATENYKKAIDLAAVQGIKAPEDASLSADLAAYYASIGDAAHSLPLIRKALALSPDDSRISYVAGESYELIGHRDKAIPLVSKAIALGYQPAVFRRSPEMASLRTDPAFQAALVEAKAKNAVDIAK